MARRNSICHKQAVTQAAVLNRIARIDGVYTENFNNETAPFILDAEAIFSEFYFNVADNHKLTWVLDTLKTGKSEQGQLL